MVITLDTLALQFLSALYLCSFRQLFLDLDIRVLLHSCSQFVSKSYFGLESAPNKSNIRQLLMRLLML
jgi:hypothetical protein